MSLSVVVVVQWRLSVHWKTPCHRLLDVIQHKCTGHINRRWKQTTLESLCREASERPFIQQHSYSSQANSSKSDDMSCKLRCGGSKYKLVYFNGKGRAETIRLVLAAAGVNYEDKRIEQADWPALKPNTPWGSLPILEVDGKTIGQSMSIARFVAREACLAGKCGVDQALVDSIVDSITDLREKAIELMMTKDESAKEKGFRKFNEETLETALGNLDKILGSKNYFVGDKMSLADIHFYAVLEAIVGSNPGALKGYPKLKDLFDRVASSPKVAEYLKKRPTTAF